MLVSMRIGIMVWRQIHRSQHR